MCAPSSEPEGSSSLVTKGHTAEFDEDFFMYRAKVEMCPRQDVHSYSTCPYLHPNELAARRDPQLFNYDSIFCYDLHNTQVCKRGANCPYAHNLFEYFLHPSRFRTRLCEYGENCKRELCFFAHNEQQLRARKAVKTHSGGRRSGKQHRAPVAARAAMGQPDAACGLPGVHILPMVPGLSLAAGCTGPSQQFECVSPEQAFARMSLTSSDSMQQQQQQQHNAAHLLTPAAAAAAAQAGGAVAVHPHAAPVMILHHPGHSSESVDGLMRAVSDVVAQPAPAGGGGQGLTEIMPNLHSLSAPLVPVACMELWPSGTPPASLSGPHAAVMQEARHANSYVMASSNAAGWPPGHSQQQQEVLMPRQHMVLAHQQQQQQQMAYPQQMQQQQVHMFVPAAPAAAAGMMPGAAASYSYMACGGTPGMFMTVGAAGGTGQCIATSATSSPGSHGLSATAQPQLQGLLPMQPAQHYHQPHAGSAGMVDQQQQSVMVVMNPLQ